jgi:hypothetical protein
MNAIYMMAVSEGWRWSDGDKTMTEGFEKTKPGSVSRFSLAAFVGLTLRGLG